MKEREYLGRLLRVRRDPSEKDDPSGFTFRSEGPLGTTLGDIVISYKSGGGPLLPTWHQGFEEPAHTIGERLLEIGGIEAEEFIQQVRRALSVRTREGQFQNRLLQIETKIDELRSELAERPITKTVVLHDLGDLDPRLALRVPISITMEEYDDGVVAAWPEVELYADAAAEGLAIVSLKKRIVELYVDLSGSSPEQLGRLPTAWLSTLRAVITEG